MSNYNYSPTAVKSVPPSPVSSFNEVTGNKSGGPWKYPCIRMHQQSFAQKLTSTLGRHWRYLAFLGGVAFVVVLALIRLLECGLVVQWTGTVAVISSTVVVAGVSRPRANPNLVQGMVSKERIRVGILIDIIVGVSMVGACTSTLLFVNAIRPLLNPTDLEALFPQFLAWLRCHATSDPRMHLETTVVIAVIILSSACLPVLLLVSRFREKNPDQNKAFPHSRSQYLGREPLYRRNRPVRVLFPAIGFALLITILLIFYVLGPEAPEQFTKHQIWNEYWLFLFLSVGALVLLGVLYLTVPKPITATVLTITFFTFATGTLLVGCFPSSYQDPFVQPQFMDLVWIPLFYLLGGTFWLASLVPKPPESKISAVYSKRNPLNAAIPSRRKRQTSPQFYSKLFLVFALMGVSTISGWFFLSPPLPVSPKPAGLPSRERLSLDANQIQNGPYDIEINGTVGWDFFAANASTS